MHLFVLSARIINAVLKKLKALNTHLHLLHQSLKNYFKHQVQDNNEKLLSAPQDYPDENCSTAYRDSSHLLILSTG
jgi:hypothetical protein